MIRFSERSGIAFAAGCLAACLIGGCGSVKEKSVDARPEPAPAPARAQQQAPSPPAQAAVKAPPPQRKSAPATRAEVAAGKPTGGLSVRSECKSRDEAGYTETIRLALDRGKVDLLEARIEIPRRGSCGFSLADFRQTRSDPHVELKSNNGSACTVRMWQQESRLTVAFNDCQDKCTSGAFQYVWPVQLNSADGSCL